MSILTHLNEFGQLNGQGIQFSDSLKVLFRLTTLLESWDTFRTTISNTAKADGLSSATVESSLLTEEVKCKNNKGSHNSGSALTFRGRSIERGKKEDKSRLKSKSRRSVKDLECYHCGKKGHLKKNCRAFKKENEKDKK